jgi:hypothetical protein
MTDPASGWFDQHRWWIRTDNADPTAVQIASAHESHHRQLQHATSHGTVTVCLHRVAQSQPESDRGRVVADLVQVSTAVHEAFATWCSITALGHPRSVLDPYPAYLRHYDTINNLITEVQSPYVRFHTVHAIARVCMQTPIADIALNIGLDQFLLADIPRRYHPDHRYTLLRRNPPDWETLQHQLTAVTHDHPEINELLNATILRAELFATSLHDAWQTVNEIVYNYIAGHLANLGTDTITHNGHLTTGEPPHRIPNRLRTQPATQRPIKGGINRTSSSSQHRIRRIHQRPTLTRPNPHQHTLRVNGCRYRNR